MYLIVTEC